MCGVMDQHYKETCWISNVYWKTGMRAKQSRFPTKTFPTERIYINSSSSIKPSDGSAKLILVETNLSFEGPRIMFKDIRMQNNGEVCKVVVISSHVPVKQENMHDCGVLSSTTHLWDWKIYENLRISEFCEQNVWTCKTCLISMICFWNSHEFKSRHMTFMLPNPALHPPEKKQDLRLIQGVFLLLSI